MRTILFHSYKGGQGRTSSLVNVATTLYRLGHNVAILDLDVESAGVPPKFGHSAFERGEVDAAGGVIDYLADLASESRAAVPSIAPHCIRIADRDDGPDISRTGSLFYIPSACITLELFRKKLAKDGLQLLFQRPPTAKSLKPLDGLRKAIERLDPKPQYLLVDLSSGITSLVEHVYAAWAETVVMFFSLDKENVDGTNFLHERFLGAVRDARSTAKNPIPIRTHLVLSRVGPFLSPAAEIELQIEGATQVLKAPKEYDKILLARTDPELEHNWKLHIPWTTETPKNVKLTKDYLTLVSTICPEVKSGSPSSRLRFMRKKLRLPEHLEHAQKMFAFEYGEGVMLNLTDESDDPRNVSFKVHTFCSILDDIHSSFFRGPAQKNPQTGTHLYHAGYLAGKQFGNNLLSMWRKAGQKQSITKRIEQWCLFDSEVGFGRLTASLDNQSQGTIHIAKNFLAHRRTQRQTNLCELMRGYLTGVLERISQRKVRVTHGSNQCQLSRSSGRGCDFTFVFMKP